MSKGVWAFRPAELKRAIQFAEKAGKVVSEAEIDRVTGKIVLKFGESGASVSATINEWDEAA